MVDSSGDIYLSSYYGQTVDKFSPSGTLLWSVDPRQRQPDRPLLGGDGVQLRAGDEPGAGHRVQPGAQHLDRRHQRHLPADRPGRRLRDPGGRWQPALLRQRLRRDGQPDRPGAVHLRRPNIEGNNQHTGSGSQFYYPAQAVQGPDGTIYTADPLHTMEATSPVGYLKGSTTLGGTLNFGGWGFALVADTFYFQSGPAFNDVGRRHLHVLALHRQDYLAPSRRRPTRWAGARALHVGHRQLLRPGHHPGVDATFDPWWISQAARPGAVLLGGERRQPDRRDRAGTHGAPAAHHGHRARLDPPDHPVGGHRPRPLRGPGLPARHVHGPATTLGTTCMPYTVGASGDNLDFATLPAGIGSGGPNDPRGVALNAQLGLDGFRSGQTVDWSSLLPNCNASAPTAATCGAVGHDLRRGQHRPLQGRLPAAQDHVDYWMQVSGGDSVSMALVSGGYWKADIAALVAHYATVPSGCGSCSPVTMWEPWNESNNTGWGNGGTYATSVLEPFYQAVKSVEPGTASTVLGGSTLEPSVGWWQQLIAAGGLAWMDVAAIHPYTGSNDSYEEDGMVSQVRQLQALLGSKPLWFSEVGWWSDGDYNYLGQADTMARSLIWQKVLGVPVENYFYDEGAWGNDGVSFSLIQATGADDYVKPAALATMTTSGLLAGRPYVSTPETGIPHAYQADFGTRRAAPPTWPRCGPTGCR